MGAVSSKLHFQNTITGQKEAFEPLNAPHVGMYVCGPTVYGDAHLGHARSAITFDIVFRWLRHLGYKVRYVRNITDVGHLENDADHGEDKIAKKARLEQLEPMEIVQHYSLRYHADMARLNCLPPSIEPQASAHIIEQIAMTQRIIDQGFAYVADGSVYFDVAAYNKQHDYGKLSGRKVDELLATTRDLDGQEAKRSPADFALWKKASPEHIMRWPSPWGDGFPGWHIECSVMSQKYLGEQFDIHGGGLDLLFPHHECEIAQSVACNGHEAVRYWLHNNMITLNGQKMAKSLGNTIMLHQFFDGSHPLLEQAYDPATIRFFILQAHYRSTVDFSNAALQAAQKGLDRIVRTYRSLTDALEKKKWGNVDQTQQVEKFMVASTDAMNDDLNTALVIASLFEAATWFNAASAQGNVLSEGTLMALKKYFDTFIVEVLGLELPQQHSAGGKDADLMALIIELRAEARGRKDFALSDRIRDGLAARGIILKDTKDGVVWEIA